MPTGVPAARVVAATPSPPLHRGAGSLLVGPPQVVKLEAVEGNTGVSGQAIAQISPIGPGLHIEVVRIECSGDSTDSPTLAVYRGAPEGAPADFSNAANGDVSEETNRWGVVVPGNQPLTLLWQGLSAGATMHATVTYGIYSDVPVTLP